MGHAVVAIDGPAGSGKSTVARRLARRLGYRFLPSGAFYRALGWLALDRGISPDDEAALADLADQARIEVQDRDAVRILADGQDVTDELSSQAVSDAASRVSIFPAVRRRMVELQRQAAEGAPVVAEGRDMASRVFPDAEHKFYLDASAAERARRRAAELRERGQTVDEAALARDIAARDARDRSREADPLRQMPGAVRVDTTDLSVEEVVERLAWAIRRSS
jgi:cytidylate kinase